MSGCQLLDTSGDIQAPMIPERVQRREKLFLAVILTESAGRVLVIQSTRGRGGAAVVISVLTDRFRYFLRQRGHCLSEHTSVRAHSVTCLPLSTVSAVCVAGTDPERQPAHTVPTYSMSPTAELSCAYRAYVRRQITCLRKRSA